MILSHNARSYFELLEAKVAQGMGQFSRPTPYLLADDPVIVNYELVRDVWLNGVPIREACKRHGLSRSLYYEKEDRFVKHGLPGLFPDIRTLPLSEELERLVIMVSKARPSVSQQAILRIAEAVPVTQEEASTESVSQILASHGRSVSNRPGDSEFWFRIQRTLNELNRMKQDVIKGRNKHRRQETFFHDNDPCHKRLELLRELFYQPSLGIKVPPPTKNEPTHDRQMDPLYR